MLELFLNQYKKQHEKTAKETECSQNKLQKEILLNKPNKNNGMYSNHCNYEIEQAHNDKCFFFLYHYSDILAYFFLLLPLHFHNKQQNYTPIYSTVPKEFSISMMFILNV